MYQVYIVRCSDDTLYTGISNDVQKRVGTHNRGKGAKYTRVRLPVILLEVSNLMSKSEALKLEYQIKQLPRLDKLRILKESKYLI